MDGGGATPVTLHIVVFVPNVPVVFVITGIRNLTLFQISHMMTDGGGAPGIAGNT